MRVVDVQRHWTPRSYYEAHVGSSGYPRAERTAAGYRLLLREGAAVEIAARDCDLEFHARALEDAGISTGIVSPALIATDLLPRSAALDMCQLLNEEMSKAQAESGGRIVGLATVPLLWPEVAAELIRAALVDLQLPGVWLPTNVGRRGLGELASPNAFAELDRLDAVCFLHPAPGQFDLPRHGLEPSLGFMFGTTVAACELVMSGLASRYPRIKFVHPHGGGTVPYLAARLDTYAAEKRDLVGGEAPHRPSEVLRRMFTDTACLRGGSLTMAMEFYGSSRLMFGSDFPFFSPEAQLATMREELSETDQVSILSTTAQDLFEIREPTTITGRRQNATDPSEGP